MNSRYFLLLLFLQIWSRGSGRKNPLVLETYQRFTHVMTNRVLTAYGHATDRPEPDEQKFRAEKQSPGPINSGGKYIIFDGFFKSRNTLTIVDGCVQNKTVKCIPQNSGPKQEWYIDLGGTIASICNKSWLLTTNDAGDQYVQDKSLIPEGYELWRIEWDVEEFESPS